MTRLRRWFLPQTPDVLGLLRSQMDVTVAGMDAFAAWSSGNAAAGEVVRGREHEADTVRRDLQSTVREAFSTPLDPQDIYALSERLDMVLNGAKNAVQEAEVMRIVPTPTTADMAVDLAEGVRHLRDAVAALTTDTEAATASADAAIRCERRIEHTYRAAMSALLDEEDLRQVIAWREIYRRYARIGNHLVEVAERVWYIAVK